MSFDLILASVYKNPHARCKIHFPMHIGILIDIYVLCVDFQCFVLTFFFWVCSCFPIRVKLRNTVAVRLGIEVERISQLLCTMGDAECELQADISENAAMAIGHLADPRAPTNCQRPPRTFLAMGTRRRLIPVFVTPCSCGQTTSKSTIRALGMSRFAGACLEEVTQGMKDFLHTTSEHTTTTHITTERPAARSKTLQP